MITCKSRIQVQNFLAINFPTTGDIWLGKHVKTI